MLSGSIHYTYMPHVETLTAIESYRERCEDRVAVFTADERTVIVVADGAGGVGSGDIAAEFVLREIETELHRIHSTDQWAETLRQIDCRIISGESTAVVVDVRPYGIAGASVGDSEAWVIKDGPLTRPFPARGEGKRRRYFRSVPACRPFTAWQRFL